MAITSLSSGPMSLHRGQGNSGILTVATVATVATVNRIRPVNTTASDNAATQAAAVLVALRAD